MILVNDCYKNGMNAVQDIFTGSKKYQTTYDANDLNVGTNFVSSKETTQAMTARYFNSNQNFFRCQQQVQNRY